MVFFHPVCLFNTVHLLKLGDLPPCAFIPDRAFIRDCRVDELSFSYLSIGIFRHHLNNDIQIFLPVLSKQKKYWFETISVEIPKWTFLYNTTRKGIKNSLFRQKQSNKNYFFKCFLACSISFVWYIWHINEIKKEVHLSPFYNTLIHIGTRVFRTNKTLDF